MTFRARPVSLSVFIAEVIIGDLCYIYNQAVNFVERFIYVACELKDERVNLTNESSSEKSHFSFVPNTATGHRLCRIFVTAYLGYDPIV